MSIRTIIEINHDHIGGVRVLGDLHEFVRGLLSMAVTEALNNNAGKPFVWGGGQVIRVLGQRHHSEPEWEQVKGSSAASAEPLTNEGAIHPLAAAEPLELLIDEVGRMRRALDSIYGHNEAARAAVVQHYGLHHKDISLLVNVLRRRFATATQGAPTPALPATEQEMNHG